MGIPTEEQETVIQFSRNDKTANIYTSDSTVMTKLDKIYKRSKESKQGGVVVACEYDVPKRLISFRSKVVKMTEEQRAANAARLKAAREKQAQDKP